MIILSLTRIFVHCKLVIEVDIISGTGTNLKVGAPVRSKAPENFFVVPLQFFGSKSTISRFLVSAFVMVSIQFD